MKQNRWKKIIGIILLVGVLIISFWYGGNAPGLQGFSVDSEVEENVINEDKTSEAETDKDSNDDISDYTADEKNNDKNIEASESEDSKKEKKTGLLTSIVMKVKKVSSSGKTRKNNPQLNKKAQKNANRAADKSIKKNKKKKNKNKIAKNNSDSNSKSVDDKNENNASDSNNIDSSNVVDNAHEPQNGITDDNRINDNISTENDNKTNNNITEQDVEKSDESSSKKSVKDDEGEFITCTIYISCASVLSHMDQLSSATKKVIPEDGIILNLTEVKVKKDATVFDVLQKAARDNKIHFEYNYTPAYKTCYIEGIGNLYQFDVGNLSGWLYSVNDEYPGVGCSSCKVEDGDSIKWVYTCNFGKDVGGYVETK